MGTQAPEVDADKFWKDGYTVVRNAFTPEEISRWRSLAYEHPDHRGDLLSHPGVWPVVFHDNVAHAAATILGSTPVYFGDGCVTIGQAGRRYHKDNADRYDARAPDWRDPYTLVRVGIYLQDHTEKSGGLSVRSGSHMTTSLRRGRAVAVDSGVGDMVIWSLRTTHGGNAVLLKLPDRMHVPPPVAQVVPEFLKKDIGQERVALFMTLGLDDEHLKRYVTYLKTRAYMVGMWKNSRWSEEVRAAGEASRIMLRDVWSEVQNDPSAGANSEYVQLPY